MASQSNERSLAAYQNWHAGLEDDPGDDSPWYRLVRAHVDPARDLTDRRILEIGCGRGGFAAWLAKHSARPREVIAADFSPAAIAIAQRSCAGEPSNLFYIVQDIQALRFDDASFDTVVSCETIEHVPAPGLAVMELARVLKPGGRLFLTTPNYLNGIGLYRGYLRLVGRPFTECGQPINNFTMAPRTLAWIRRASLLGKIVDGTKYPMLFPLPGRISVDLKFLGRMGALTRWLALHQLVVCTKRPA
jgi:2-polyprenyl-3-methyl-5-hydroxy-6-metoxy-1,4-benzoquinol methylase